MVMVKHLFLFYLFTIQTTGLSSSSKLAFTSIVQHHNLAASLVETEYKCQGQKREKEELIDTRTATLTLFHQSLLSWVSRYGVPVIYFHYPHFHCYHPSPMSLLHLSIHEIHYKTQTRPPVLSELPETPPNSDNLSLLWGADNKWFPQTCI